MLLGGLTSSTLHSFWWHKHRKECPSGIFWERLLKIDCREFRMIIKMNICRMDNIISPFCMSFIYGPEKVFVQFECWKKKLRVCLISPSSPWVFRKTVYLDLWRLLVSSILWMRWYAASLQSFLLKMVMPLCLCAVSVSLFVCLTAGTCIV